MQRWGERLNYKAYNKVKKEWDSNVFINQFGYVYKKGRFSLKRINQNEYEFYRDTECKDVVGNPIFEGDILKDKDGNNGIIFYSDENAAFLFFVYEQDKVYAIGKELYKNACIIGNVIDNYELVKDYFERPTLVTGNASNSVSEYATASGDSN